MEASSLLSQISELNNLIRQEINAYSVLMTERGIHWSMASIERMNNIGSDTTYTYRLDSEVFFTEGDLEARKVELRMEQSEHKRKQYERARDRLQTELSVLNASNKST